MEVNKPLNLFYAEPDPDRWLRYDRYPRRLIRRLVRGKQRPGGVMTIAINLMKGLDKIGVPYRFNDYKYIKKHPGEIACIIGKPHLLFDRKWENPIMFGAGVYSHPVDCPDLFERYPNVKRFLVPGEWMRLMCAPFYGDKVKAWPVGIDTEHWQSFEGEKEFDFLIYNKIPQGHPRHGTELVNPIVKTLNERGLSFHFIRYGGYTHQELIDKLKTSKAAIFLSEHETQGLACQQILATNTPILAWDPGGYWPDPDYYPDKVKYQPVSSVPYWDERCGAKFTSAGDFEQNMELFLNALDSYRPRDYVMENLTLEICAQKYIDLHNEVEMELK